MIYAPSPRLTVPFLRRALLALPFIAVLLTSTVRAHDPYQSWSSAILRDDHLELTVTMAETTAFRLIESDKARQPLTQENFQEYRPLLVKAAAKLCVLTANKDVLKSNKIEVEHTDENDITFKVIYPRPSVGKLHLYSAYLEKLGDGYGAILEVADTLGNHLGWDQLTSDNPSLEVAVPAKGPAKKT